MTYRLFSFLMILHILTNPIIAHSESDKKFQVFEATLFRDKPNFSLYGIQTMPIVYGHFLYPNRTLKDTLPKKLYIQTILSDLKYDSAHLCLDVEHWEIISGADNSVSIEKYRKLLSIAKQRLPRSKIGYYGIPPKRDYFASVSPRSTKKYQEWVNVNQELMKLGKEADLVFPSLYTFYNKPQVWLKFAINSVSAAKLYRKPVYPFIWPQYHQSNNTLGYTYIDPAFWRLQLETVYRTADGLVIWGGWDYENKKAAVWDENAPWWQVTKSFLVQKGLISSQPLDSTN